MCLCVYDPFYGHPNLFVSKGHSGAGQLGGGGGSKRAAEPSGALVRVRSSWDVVGSSQVDVKLING